MPNTSFETWISSGRPAPFNWEEPQGWKSTNAVTEFIAAGITESNDPFIGNSAVDIRSLNIFGSNVPGVLANGNPPLEFFPNNTITIEKGGTPISSKPTSLTGHYKFTGASITDSAYVVVLLKKYNTINNKIDTIGIGDMLLEEQSNYTFFTVPVTYIDTVNNPDSIVVAFYSSNPMSPQANNNNGTGFKIDNIALNFTTDLREEKKSNFSFEIYPNPFYKQFSIHSGSIGKGELRIYSLSGKLVQEKALLGQSSLITINAETLYSGIYFIELSNAKGEKLRKKLVKR